MNDIICKICSNGCRLQSSQKDGITFIEGHKCSKGKKLLKTKILQEYPDAIFKKGKGNKEDSILKQIAKEFNISFKKNKATISIQGSPERSLFRTVIEDKDSKLYLIEEIAKESLKKRKVIAKRLASFKKKELPCITYKAFRKNEYILEYKKRFWMCQDYIAHAPLNRKNYWKESEKGKALASFLLDLEKVSQSTKKKKNDFFSLSEYIDSLVKTIKKLNNDVYKATLPLYELLQTYLFPIYNELPETFSHGDPHPLNMIWGKENIKAVIDWEFSGFKSKLYDVSLILGCVGTEDESALDSEFVTTFLNKLYSKEYLSPKEWHYLPLFMMAQRFAWLSEWLRRKDSEMIEFELFYMRHIVQWKPHFTKEDKESPR